MNLIQQEITHDEVCHHTNTIVEKNYLRQNSVNKRRYCQNSENTEFEEISQKRRYNTTNNSIPCPVASFGCLKEVQRENLVEHYSSQDHQKALLKAIQLFVKQLHKDFEIDSTLSNDRNDYSEIARTIEILSDGVSCIYDDNVQLHTNISQLSLKTLELQKQIEHLKVSIDETSQISQAAQMNNHILQTETENIKQMMTDLNCQSSNDGTFIWKITDVTNKISEAVAERQISIYSPPFYTSPTGYKMCLRLYLNGDGQARRTHLSLFFVLMRGKYDAILQWPFSYKIIFCLMDQTGAQHHLIDSFRPDTKSNSFQRPRSNMNIASGIPKFCPFSIIQQNNNPYVRDDCMFIRCFVDMSSTPKPLIPYMCSLNPGLSTFIQREAIEKEIQRHSSLKSTESNLIDSLTTVTSLK